MKNSKKLLLKILSTGMDKKTAAKKLKKNDGTVNIILIDSRDETYKLNGNTISKDEYDKIQEDNKDSLQYITIKIEEDSVPFATSEDEVIM